METTAYKIIYEDDWLLAVDKPTGMVVNRSHTTKSITLQDLLAPSPPEGPEEPEKDLEPLGESTSDDFISELDVVPESSPVADVSAPISDPAEELVQSDYIARSGIIHRLDKDTSGVLLVAKTEESFIQMQQLFKNREVKKTYKAVVYGEFPDDEALIDAPLGRNPKMPFKIAVVPDGRPSVTHLFREKVSLIDDTKYSLLTIQPKTGRTHQIRVHLAATSHPIVGDVIYSSRKQLETSSTYFNRLMLHAQRLQFSHPVTHEMLDISSDIPQEFLIYF